jgi:hypothetical protein
MRPLLTTIVLVLGASVLVAAPYLTIVFEYTVGPDGSRKNLHVFRVEDPQTRQELKTALTEKELDWGFRLVAQRKPPVEQSRTEAIRN